MKNKNIYASGSPRVGTTLNEELSAVKKNARKTTHEPDYILSPNIIGINLTTNQLLNLRYAVEQQAILNRSLAVDCQKDSARIKDYTTYNAIAIFYEDMFVKFGDILKEYGLLVDSNSAIFIPSGRSDNAKIITRIGGE